MPKTCNGQGMRFCVLLGTILAGTIAPKPPVALAWESHGLITLPALETLPALSSSAPVPAETFTDFILATQDRLVAILEEEETWARAHVPNYAPLPDALRWRGQAPREQAHALFMAALRLNPGMKLPLFRTLLPHQAIATTNPISLADVSVIPKSLMHAKPQLAALQPGETIAPLDILFTAVDEPDFGLDIGLWDDNGTPFGHSYGFGPQPFGNPQLEFSSQAPFHMGFYFEDAIIYKAAPFLGKTFPEMRIHQFMTLARFALQNGHPYWGYRFLGWGLHYLQDLAQPYHACVLPGVSTGRMLLINGLAILGWEGPKDRAIHLVSNRHLALENFQWSAMIEAYEGSNKQHPFLLAPANRGADSHFGNYNDQYPRAKAAFTAHKASSSLDEALAKLMPSQFVNDPDYIFSVSDPDINMTKMFEMTKSPSEGSLMQTVIPMLEAAGAHSRAYVNYALEPKALDAPQKP